ncbi:hypothetical protein [Fusobacterium periodonticum]|jgi:putative uncharacterized protein FNV2246|uniref:hypothetical protein n=1 Tax=Fusobacterium periodonticum TaxID=860 RepID=UPI0028D5E1B8|nr:hypothetical protein [Fusobacterium periodonticum]
MKDLYFISEETKIIFALVELDKKPQLDLLGVDYYHYAVIEAGQKWYHETKDILEKSNHPKAKEAMKQLEKIFKGMGHPKH